MFQTLMEKEAAQTPHVIKKQLIANQPLVEKIGQKLRDIAPKMVMIIGRGSSDHAGVFGKYLIEIEAGIPVSSAAPSVASIYGKSIKLQDALVIVISLVVVFLQVARLTRRRKTRLNLRNISTL